MQYARLVASLFVTVSTALPAQSSGLLQPTSKWTVEYADDLCMLARDYGSVSEPLSLLFQPEVMGHGQKFIVVTSRRSASFSSRKVRLQADGKDVPIAAQAYSTILQGNRLSRSGFDLTNQELAQIRHASRLSIDVGSGLRFHFTVPGLSKALVALEVCRSDLVSGWGISPAKQQALAIPAAPLRQLSTYLSADDYPSGALGTSGKARVRLTVSEAGMVSHCAVVYSSGNKLLDQASCQTLQKRARFKPAQDSAGTPMWSFVVSEISWLSE